MHVAGVLRGRFRHEERPEEEHISQQQHSHDHAQAPHVSLHPGSPCGAPAKHRLQGAERLGRVQVGRSDVLVAGRIAGGRQLQRRTVDHGSLEASLEQWPTEEDQRQSLGSRGASILKKRGPSRRSFITLYTQMLREEEQR